MGSIINREQNDRGIRKEVDSPRESPQVRMKYK